MQDVKEYWVKKLKVFLPEYIADHHILNKFADKLTIALSGSTVRGVDDPFSDIDILLFLSNNELTKLDAFSHTRFFEIEIDNKPGHITVESKDFWKDRVMNCDMEYIFQLRNAEIIIDNTNSQSLFTLACKKMRGEVSSIFFCYHYIEMRSWHRACDNPMERHDPTATLLSLPRVIAHALRATLVLHKEPYPYEKWLYRMSLHTSTGQMLKSSIDTILNLLGDDILRFTGRESENPLSQELRTMRRILIEAANNSGIHEPWLDKWWLHMDKARDAIKKIKW